MSEAAEESTADAAESATHEKGPPETTPDDRRASEVGTTVHGVHMLVPELVNHNFQDRSKIE